LRCAAFSAAPPSCHFTAAPRWCPFPGLTCSLALRGHDPLRKLASHACSRGQGLRDGCSVPSITLRDTAPACSPTGTPLRAALPSQVEISWCTGWRARCFLLETFEPGLVLSPHSDRKGQVLPVRRAPPQLPWPPDARRPTARCSVASCLPARSRVPVTRVCCPVHVCVDRTLPQHGERAHQALAVAKGQMWRGSASAIRLGCAHGPRPAIDRSMYHAMYGYKTNIV
jgi:hypothetical protein